MNYDETINFLFNQFPEYQKVGNAAYKPGLGNIKGFDRHLGYPHKSYKCIHVAGTNGKGSVSHTLAAVLQANGYKVGLFTSPHLKNFTERIRVNGEEVTRDFVCDFVERNFDYLRENSLSFFEVTTGMAFEYFKCQKVDFAVIEVGLGGRLDSTNVIEPILSVITNIGLDHTALLGNTLGKIAAEKGGIIKQGVPVIVGERNSKTDKVFMRIANKQQSELRFASDCFRVANAIEEENFTKIKLYNRDFVLSEYEYGLSGMCQSNNFTTIIAAIDKLIDSGVVLTDEGTRRGLASVQEMTGLVGRWQKIKSNPTVIIDTGHNTHAVRYIAQQLEKYAQKYDTIHIVWGMSSDKNPQAVLHMLPQTARYYFTQADTHRAVPAAELLYLGKEEGLNGLAYDTVAKAYGAALKAAKSNDMILVGGSNFVVAEIV